MKQLIFVITAASATGKTSCVKLLCVKDKHLVQSISYSTRPKRPGEVDGIDKFFITNQAFDALQADQQLVEQTKIFGHRCGHTKASLEKQADDGKDILMILDYQGLQQIKSVYPNTVSIFILPPSTQAISDRIYQRPEADGVDIESRIRSAKSEMKDYSHYDYLVFNDKIDNAVADMQAIISAERLKTRQQAVRYQEEIRQLIEE